MLQYGVSTALKGLLVIFLLGWHHSRLLGIFNHRLIDVQNKKKHLSLFL